MTASNGSATAPDPLSFAVSRYDSVTKAAYATRLETWTIAPEPSAEPSTTGLPRQNAAGVRRGHISRFQPGTGATPADRQWQVHGVPCGQRAGHGPRGRHRRHERPRGGRRGRGHRTHRWTPPWHTTVTGPTPGLGRLRHLVVPTTDARHPLPDLETNKFGADVALTPDGKYVVFGGPTQVATKGWNVTSGPPIAGSKYISLAQVSRQVSRHREQRPRRREPRPEHGDRDAGVLAGRHEARGGRSAVLLGQPPPQRGRSGRRA